MTEGVIYLLFSLYAANIPKIMKPTQIKAANTGNRYVSYFKRTNDGSSRFLIPELSCEPLATVRRIIDFLYNMCISASDLPCRSLSAAPACLSDRIPKFVRVGARQVPERPHGQYQNRSPRTTLGPA